jgi:hypothetical protein
VHNYAQQREKGERPRCFGQQLAGIGERDCVTELSRKAQMVYGADAMALTGDIKPLARRIRPFARKLFLDAHSMAKCRCATAQPIGLGGFAGRG